MPRARAARSSASPSGSIRASAGSWRCRRPTIASVRSGISSAMSSHLPAAGEIVLFDRSWYNRAGVERVMGFCTPEEYEEFFRSVPEFERMLVRSGITAAQVLVLDHGRGAVPALPRPHPRSAEAVEAQPHGSRVAPPLGGLHAGEGDHAGALAHSRGALVGGAGRRQEARAAELHRSSAEAVSLQGSAERPRSCCPSANVTSTIPGRPCPADMLVPEVY